MQIKISLKTQQKLQRDADALQQSCIREQGCQQRPLMSLAIDRDIDIFRQHLVFFFQK